MALRGAVCLVDVAGKGTVPAELHSTGHRITVLPVSSFVTRDQGEGRTGCTKAPSAYDEQQKTTFSHARRRYGSPEVSPDSQLSGDMATWQSSG